MKKNIQVLVQIILLAYSCELQSEFETPSLYEPFGYATEDALYIYSSCFLHSIHCDILFHTYDLS